MTSIIRDLYDEYHRSLPHADPHSRNWFLLQNNPVYVWIITILYLLVIWLGPKYMADRPAYSLKTFLVVYNLGLVALSLYMAIEIMLSTRAAGLGWFCAEYNEESRKHPAAPRVAAVLWWYFFSKVIELMDTVLMILRKRSRQITFLHVFHHASILNIWWWTTMFIPGGLSFFGSGLNSLVHVVMYLYYGLSAIPSLRDKLWWKNYITRFQLIQFFVTLSHTLNSYANGCDFPLWGKNLLAGYMIIMLALFMNFYYKSYMIRRGLKEKPSPNGTNGIIVKHDDNGVIQNGQSRVYNNNSNGTKKEL